MENTFSSETKTFQNFNEGNDLFDGSDSCSINTFATETEATLRPYLPLRQQILNTLHSTKYNVIVVSLVVLDTLIVMAELLLDLELSNEHSTVPKVLHGISLFLLTLFTFEIFVKLYGYRMEFFTHKGEVFDAIVVIIALGLDAASLHSHGAFVGSGLVIILRLWRVVRIQNSMVMSVHKAGERRLAQEREARRSAEAELEICKEENRHLVLHIDTLKNLLEENSITIPQQPDSFYSPNSKK